MFTSLRISGYQPPCWPPPTHPPRGAPLGGLKDVRLVVPCFFTHLTCLPSRERRSLFHGTLGKKIDWKQWFFEGNPISSQDGNILNPDDFPLFNQLIFRFHVNFLGCIRGIQQNSWRIIGVWLKDSSWCNSCYHWLLAGLAFGYWLLLFLADIVMQCQLIWYKNIHNIDLIGIGYDCHDDWRWKVLVAIQWYGSIFIAIDLPRFSQAQISCKGICGTESPPNEPRVFFFQGICFTEALQIFQVFHITLSW